MSTIRLQGTLLAATDDALTYLMLPYGQPGRTSKGLVTASAGAVTVPEDIVKTAFGNLDHDRTKPAAKFASVEETDAGLVATFRPLGNTYGRDLLIEAREGVRTGVSVELDEPVIQNGALLGGVLSGAGFTSTPAFPDAQLIAADMGTTRPEPSGPGQTVATTERSAIMAGTNTAVSDVTLNGTFTGEIVAPDPAEDPATDPAAPEAAAAAPVTASSTTAVPRLVASAPAGLPLGVVPRQHSANEVYARLTAAAASGNPDQLRAAVDQTVADDVAAVTGQGSWLGETFARRDYPRRYAPLFSQLDLTGLKMTGWRFDYDPDTAGGGAAARDTTPEVDAYDGYPAEPASKEVKTKAVEVKATRYAGYNEYDREVDDFPGDFPGFWEGFFREQGRSVDQKVDNAALTHMLTAANYTAIAADAGTAAGDLATATAILNGITATLDIATPDFALIPTAQWKALYLQREDDAFANLGITLSFDPNEASVEGRLLIVPSSHATLAAGAGDGGKVLVGSKSQHTLWGEKRFRAQTVNVANGGNTIGLYAYAAMLTRDPRAFALCTIQAAA